MAIQINRGGEWDYQFRDRPPPYPYDQVDTTGSLLTEDNRGLLAENGQQIIVEG